MLEEANANVAEALEWRRDEGEPLGERAQVTVTPAAGRRFLGARLTPRPMRPLHGPVDVSAPMEGGRRARESRIA
jgi:hypothetical protein